MSISTYVCLLRALYANILQILCNYRKPLEKCQISVQFPPRFDVGQEIKFTYTSMIKQTDNQARKLVKTSAYSDERKILAGSVAHWQLINKLMYVT